MFSLVLGGGGAKGYIHLGVYKYLIEKELLPHDIVGTSMGAIIGSMIAFGRGYDRIYTEIQRFSIYTIVGVPSFRGVVSYKKVKEYAQELFGKARIEESEIPLSIIAYDINTGQKIIFREGSLIDALIASCSIPGVFEPHPTKDTIGMDGGIAYNLSCEEAQTKSVIAISTMGIHSPLDKKCNMITLCLRSLNHLVRQNEDFSILKAELLEQKKITLIRPDLSLYEMHNFEKYDTLIQIGYNSCIDILC